MKKIIKSVIGCAKRIGLPGTLSIPAITIAVVISFYLILYYQENNMQDIQKVIFIQDNQEVNITNVNYYFGAQDKFECQCNTYSEKQKITGDLT